MAFGRKKGKEEEIKGSISVIRFHQTATTTGGTCTITEEKRLSTSPSSDLVA